MLFSPSSQSLDDFVRAASAQPAMSYRDVVLIDLARFAAAKAPFDLDSMQCDTAELHSVLKAKADGLGFPSGASPEPSLDVLEPFALAWARDRAAERRKLSSEKTDA